MNNKFIKNTLSLFSGTLAGQLLIILSSPFLTRIYSLEEFGQLAIFTSILSIFINGLSFRYEMAFINIKAKKAKLTLMKGISILILLTSSILVVLLLLLEQISILNYFEQSFIYFLLWISLLAIGFYNALSHFAISEDAISDLSLSKFQQAFTLIVIQLISGVFNYKNGLILGDSLSRISGITVLIKNFDKRDYKQIYYAKFVDVYLLFKKYKDYAKYSVISGVSNNFVMQSLPLILAIFYAQPLIGMLTIIQRVLVMPIKLISQSIKQSFMNEIMTHLQEKNHIKIKSILYKIVLILSIISILPAAVFMIYGERLFILVLGSNLEGSAKLINALMILSVFQFIFIPISQTLEFIEEQKVHFQWQVLRFLVVLIALILFPIYGLSFSFVIYIYVSIMAAFYIMLMLITINQLNKKIYRF